MVGEQIKESIIVGEKRPDLLKEETLADLFRQSAAKYADKTALIFEQQSLCYQQLDQWSDAIAADLAARGIGKGNNVAIWWRRGLELHAAILGIVKAGAAYVPIDREMPAERVELVLSEVKASACFSRFALNTDCTLLTVIPMPAANETFPAPAGPDPDSCAYILYTSGSTGKPKGIPISHRNICHLVRAEQTVLDIRADDRVYQGFSVSFDMWCEETWISYFAGATLWVADNTTSKAIDELSRVLNVQKITVFHAVPSLLAVMDEDVPLLRIVNAGGEACTLQVVNKWHKPGRKFYNSYGPTETTVTATMIQLQPGDPITIGDPLPNYNLAVIDAHFNVLPRGERGELVISGPGVSKGYVHLPELTEKKFVNKPATLLNMPGDRIYLTGDAAVITQDGSIDFQGRLDDQVKLRGYRIELGEIESKLSEQPNVSAAAAAIKKDSAGNDHLVGYIIPTDEVCLDENGLRAALSKVLPSYMVPVAIVSLPAMPRMPSGKINRKELPIPLSLQELEEDNPGDTVNLNAPLADRVVALLRKTFPGKAIDLSQDFFTDLGGHSLIAAGFISRLRREGGVPYASLKDVYIHRPLKELVTVWEKTPQTIDESPRAQFHAVPPWRYYACWSAQTLSLFLIYALFTVEVFTPYLSYYYLSEETGNPLIGVLAAIVFYCLIPPVFTGLIVAAKWLIIGKMKEGDYPLWGSYYFRWWLVKTMQRLVPAQFLSGTPLYPHYLRMFGVKVSSDAQLSNISIGAEDLITIGSDASLSSQVVLDNAFVEDGLLKLRSIAIGPHSYIGSSAVVAGNTSIDNYGELQDLSYLPPGGKIKEGEIWSGSPAQLKEKKQVEDLPVPMVVTSTKKLFYTTVFFFTLFIFPLFVLIPLFPIIFAIHYLDDASAAYDFTYILSVPALATLYMFLFGFETVLFTRLLNAGIKTGTYSIYSWRYVRKWLSDQILSVSLVVMHPIYATVYVTRFFRLLGARVGRNTEISTASSVTHPLLEIGDDAFVADAVTLGEADVRAQQLILGKTIINHNSFIGNSALIPQGYNLPSNMLIGVLSTPPDATQLAASAAKDWFGSPGIPMPQRQQSNPFANTLTTNPPFARRLARSIIEFIRIILPETAIIVFSILFIAFAHDLIVEESTLKIIAFLPLYYLAFIGIPALLLTVVLKWVFAGKYKALQKPMWTRKVWLSEAITTTYEALAIPFLLDFLRGTPWLPLCLRLFGTKTGKRVYMNTTDITEFDMVNIGTDAALNEDSGPQTHLFEDRVMKVGGIKIGERTSIGARSIILYDTTIGNDVKIDALSLIMKGEVLSPNTSWIGSPVKPA
ncbi:MAG: amino acid adenylation domain-containing protein [Bacteroidota bacterium]|nr:amino acid adenylation domain-containing protein [Bacteroidota bacterium]